jgi:hypothetical protein
MNATLDHLRPYEARLNITHDGRNGDYVEPVPFDASDAELKRMAAEAIRAGLLGEHRGPVDLGGFVVDRFPATERYPVNRVFLRPKTPFG